MTVYETVKLVHIVAVTVWLGGAFFIVIAGFRMPSAPPAHRIGFARDALFLGQRVFVPSIVLALAAGVWMVMDVDPVYTFEQAWIAVALVALLVSAGIGTGIILPRTRRALGFAEAGDGAAAASMMQVVSRAGRINAVVLLVALAAMVFKPGL